MLPKLLLLMSLTTTAIFASETYNTHQTQLPKLKMADNNLTFEMIEGYQDYKIVATHFRTDKNELRYILANPIGYNALLKGAEIMPEGSKIVKIGWSVKKMPLFPAALEADKLQRVEYMVKDSKSFDADGDNWGYARFVKNGDKFESWKKGTNGCISCHSVAKENDYLFTKMQSTFK
ncbi:MAG: cytochrome P460 family protein [Sulfurimonas sp.]|uniref:cytochrome P460 family protein n=1 Tax=Sulfurimonas sp. TaxID=2022749 RepID=UPI003D140761